MGISLSELEEYSEPEAMARGVLCCTTRGDNRSLTTAELSDTCDMLLSRCLSFTYEPQKGACLCSSSAFVKVYNDCEA
jgi:hypothetical protein